MDDADHADKQMANRYIKSQAAETNGGGYFDRQRVRSRRLGSSLRFMVVVVVVVVVVVFCKFTGFLVAVLHTSPLDGRALHVDPPGFT